MISPAMLEKAGRRVRWPFWHIDPKQEPFIT